MSSGGRPPGPLKMYTVECIFPTEPGRYRQAVVNVDERVARRSVSALKVMHYALQVKISFHKPTTSRALLGSCLAAQWDRFGNVTYRDLGEFSQYIPEWVTGDAPLVEEKTHEFTMAGS